MADPRLTEQTQAESKHVSFSSVVDAFETLNELEGEVIDAAAEFVHKMNAHGAADSSRLEAAVEALGR